MLLRVKVRTFDVFVESIVPCSLVNCSARVRNVGLKVRARIKAACVLVSHHVPEWTMLFACADVHDVHSTSSRNTKCDEVI